MADSPEKDHIANNKVEENLTSEKRHFLGEVECDEVIERSSFCSREASLEIEYTGNLFSKEEAAQTLPDESTMYRALEFTFMRSERANIDEDGLGRSRKIFKDRIEEYLNAKRPLLHFENLEFEKVIGKGSFGTVWKAVWGGTREVAVKVANYLNELPKLYLERDTMVKLKNKRIVELFGVFRANFTFFVMPLYKTDLTGFKKVSEVNILRYTVQLLEAVSWIHLHNIIHCDIKPNNCLVTSENNVVLSDFGAAIYLDPAHYKRRYVHRKRLFGVPAYSDYQVNTNLYYSAANDVFALGCIVFELQTKQGFLWSKLNKREMGDRYEVMRMFDNGRKIDEMTKFLAPSHELDKERVPLKDTISAAVPYDKFLEKVLLTSSDERPPASELLKEESLLSIMRQYNVTFQNLDSCGVSDDVFAPLVDYADFKPEKPLLYFQQDTLSLGLYYLDPKLAKEWKAKIEMVDKSTETDADRFVSIGCSPVFSQQLLQAKETPTSTSPAELSLNANQAALISVNNLPNEKRNLVGQQESVASADGKSKKARVTETLLKYVQSLPLWKKLEQELEAEDPVSHMRTEAQVVLNLERALQLGKNNVRNDDVGSSRTLVPPEMALRKRSFSNKVDIGENKDCNASPAEAVSTSSSRKRSKKDEKITLFTNLFEAPDLCNLVPEKLQIPSRSEVSIPPVLPAINVGTTKLLDIPISQATNDGTKGKTAASSKFAEVVKAADFYGKDNTDTPEKQLQRKPKKTRIVEIKLTSSEDEAGNKEVQLKKPIGGKRHKTKKMKKTRKASKKKHHAVSTEETDDEL